MIVCNGLLIGCSAIQTKQTNSPSDVIPDDFYVCRALVNPPWWEETNPSQRYPRVTTEEELKRLLLYLKESHEECFDKLYLQYLLRDVL